MSLREMEYEKAPHSIQQTVHRSSKWTSEDGSALSRGLIQQKDELAQFKIAGTAARMHDRKFF